MEIKSTAILLAIILPNVGTSSFLYTVWNVGDRAVYCHKDHNHKLLESKKWICFEMFHLNCSNFNDGSKHA